MPKLSEFFGIKITLRTREKCHNLPHFHAVYGSEKVSIAIETLQVLSGKMNPRALGLVIEWAFQHRPELQVAWDDLKSGRMPSKIEPLR
jgi:hypothetical protein